MGKWIRETDCEGKSVSYKCDKCGFDDGWHNYNLCPMCGDPKETESEDDEDDEDDEDGTGIAISEDLKLLCIRFECIHSDGTGRCRIQDEFDIHGLSCGRYKRR